MLCCGNFTLPPPNIDCDATADVVVDGVTLFCAVDNFVAENIDPGVLFADDKLPNAGNTFFPLSLPIWPNVAGWVVVTMVGPND